MRTYNQFEPTVLVVEETRTLRNHIERSVKRRLNVMQSKNGLDALQKMKTNPSIRLVIANLWMPKVDGFELLSRITKSNIPGIKATPVIMVTSHQVNTPILKKLKLSGVYGVLKKPVINEDFDMMIYNALENTAENNNRINLISETKKKAISPIYTDKYIESVTESVSLPEQLTASSG